MASPTDRPEDTTRAARENVLTQTRNLFLNEGFKGLVLLNGGGAAALDAFLQAIWDNTTAAPMRIYLLYGIGSLLLGAALASILFLVRYLTFFHRNANILTKNPIWWAMIVLIVLSMLCFLGGMGYAVKGVLVSL
jgi:hypothetical protein